MAGMCILERLVYATSESEGILLFVEGVLHPGVRVGSGSLIEQHQRLSRLPINWVFPVLIALRAYVGRAGAAGVQPACA